MFNNHTRILRGLFEKLVENRDIIESKILDENHDMEKLAIKLVQYQKAKVSICFERLRFNSDVNFSRQKSAVFLLMRLMCAQKNSILKHCYDRMKTRRLMIHCAKFGAQKGTIVYE